MRPWLTLLVLTPALAAQTNEHPSWDPNELRGFVDGVMEAQQKAYHFAGAVVVIVRNGQVVLQKGYGYSDFAERKPVDPERTLFRIASNSKMFVWTAVMQLVEQGKLDLRTDVNRYLKGLEVPATFPQPVTLEHLMTHTAGFEDRVVGLFSESAEAMHPLAELMRTQMPARVFAPGQVAAYSNYGTALAALIVEQVSGIPYESYLEQKILKPLGMTHATLRQPLPPELAGDMSKGYDWTAGRFKEHPFEFVPWGPCGGMSVSGADMARFIMAHLNDGALQDARILRAETARRMRTRLSSPYSETAGMLHGFFPMDWNGQKVYGHGGDTAWFHSQTAMLPDRGLGLFVAYNTDRGGAARSEFVPVFLDHSFPKPLPKELAPPRDRRETLERFQGTYFGARSSFTDLTKIARLVTAVNLSVDSDGYLVRGGDGQTVRFRQLGPLLFEEVDGKRKIVFRENTRHEIIDFCASPLCVVAMQKQPWWESTPLQWGTLIACVAVVLGGLMGIPVAGVLQRGQVRPRGSRLARLAAWLMCLAFAAGFGVFLSWIPEAQKIVFGIPTTLRMALAMWITAAVLTVAALMFSVAAWMRRWWRLAGRLYFTLLVLGGAGCTIWLDHWNLLTWR